MYKRIFRLISWDVPFRFLPSEGDKGGAPGGAPVVTVDSIEKTSNPLERVRARATHADLYRK